MSDGAYDEMWHSEHSLGYNPQEDQTGEAVVSDVAVVGEMFVQR